MGRSDEILLVTLEKKHEIDPELSFQYSAPGKAQPDVFDVESLE
jgi:hypothetical protein